MSLKVPVGDRDHAQGPATAPVTLVEYGDYECPYCGQAYPIVKAVQARLGDRLRFVFRNMPLTQSHPHAQMAAEAAEAADAQGRFWQMHDALYEHQRHLGRESIVRLASQIGLDVERFTNDLDNGGFADRVKQDFMGGVRSGVNGTPTFFINGERHDDSWDEETLTAALLEAVRRASHRTPAR